MRPLVSVICVCYNHERFVLEALESVKSQTYPSIEIIIVDDGSRDYSKSLIKNWAHQNSVKYFFDIELNMGYCKAFNKAWLIAQGNFIIDFACDDVMLPSKIEKQVEHFKTLDNSYGISFSDAVYINEDGHIIRNHFEYLLRKNLIHNIPQGDVYRRVLSTYFIPSPTMMIKREVLELLDGYDESLAYEDFDLWVRASRNFKFGFLNERLMHIRQSAESLSSGWYQKGDTQLLSTYKVCEKAISLNRDEQDWKSWEVRMRYELRQSVFSENQLEAKLFYDLLKQQNRLTLQDKFIFSLNGLPLARLRKLYHWIRFGV